MNSLYTFQKHQSAIQPKQKQSKQTKSDDLFMRGVILFLEFEEKNIKNTEQKQLYYLISNNNAKCLRRNHHHHPQNELLLLLL